VRPSGRRGMRHRLHVVCLGCSVALGVHTAQAAGAISDDVLPVRGVVRAVQQAAIATETPLRAEQLPFREGHHFNKGDLLAAFDCRRQIAEHEAAKAVHRETVLNLDSNVQLDRHHAVGKNDVEISRAREAKAKADMTALASKLDECKFVAPFSGRVVDLGLHVHERTVPQRPYLAIIGDTQLEIEAIAPSSMLAHLRAGTTFQFKLDELDGLSVAAEVSTISATVDPVSKTVKIIAIIKQATTGILAGMSGTAIFTIGSGK
jgi:membrane fusion protein, multidrug efflux system